MAGCCSIPDFPRVGEMYKKISDYGIIGNLHTIALIGTDGSIDWLCLPYIDSPSVFGALLDDNKGGHFSLSPADEWDSVAEYISGTNILRTRFRTRTGIMEVTDFMPIPVVCKDELETGEREICRCISVTEGAMEVRMVFDPRFKYARVETLMERKGRMLIARGDGEVMSLAVSEEIPESDDPHTAQWALKEGESLWFRLKYNTGETFVCDTLSAERALAQTAEYWRTWLRRRETGQTRAFGKKP